jgi:hypothetical protein
MNSMNRRLNKIEGVKYFKMHNFWIALICLILLSIFADMNDIIKFILTFIILTAIVYEISGSLSIGLIIGVGLSGFLALMKYSGMQSKILEGFEEDKEEEEEEDTKDKEEDEEDDMIKKVNELTKNMGSGMDTEDDGEEEAFENIDLDPKKIKKFHQTQKMLQSTALELAKTINVLSPSLEKGGDLISMFNKLNLAKKKL